MATSQFKTDSPYAQKQQWKQHESDFKYKRYTNGLCDGNGATATADAGNSRRVLRVALFGLGRAGSIHLANLMPNPRVELAYVVEMDEERREVCRQRWNLGQDRIKFVHPKDVDSTVFADPLLDCCIIATPTFTHESLILSSVKAGKAVFCEKPIAQDEAGTENCYDMAAKHNTTLFCAFNRRFDPSFSALQRRVRAGEIGQAHLIKTTSRDSPLPTLDYLRTSGGIFHDCAVHDIDIITWVLGEYPVEVFSSASAMFPETEAMDDFDNVLINLKFPSGSLAVIDLSRFSSYGYDQRVEAFGRNGMIRVENDLPNRTLIAQEDGERSVPMYYSFPSRHQEGYQIELDHFLDVVKGQKDVSVTKQVTLNVSKIATACEESAKSSQVVKLTWTEQDMPEGYVQANKVACDASAE